ncbi:hypothetical protein RB653_005451 [Dictyostelium firmibasis]|uniref:Uncharacterized protein n=1 Tax=Dictyostelium firmibasis TaxID=79012 RepID=A0AAN7YSZ3_9MYCE
MESKRECCICKTGRKRSYCSITDHKFRNNFSNIFIKLNTIF